MSVSIDEAIEGAAEYAAILRGIKKRYPGAKLEKGRVFYLDGGASIEPNTVVELDGVVYLAEKVGAGWVMDRRRSRPKDIVLHELLAQPDVLEKAMAIVRGRS